MKSESFYLYSDGDPEHFKLMVNGEELRNVQGVDISLGVNQPYTVTLRLAFQPKDTTIIIREKNT